MYITSFIPLSYQIRNKFEYNSIQIRNKFELTRICYEFVLNYIRICYDRGMKEVIHIHDGKAGGIGICT
jgi:hypothetical protein